MAGLLALVGGDEFNPGNEEQDRLLAAAARPGDAFVVPTAAARQKPDQSVDHAIAWFRRFGLKLKELPVLKRKDANTPALAERARSGGFFYLVGGDPGFVATVLRGSLVWSAMFQAWRDGAVLAGSSAGAMALGSHTLIRAKWPIHINRRPVDALGVVAKTAVLPHFDTFGKHWIVSAQAAAPELRLVGVDERSAVIWDGMRWLAAGPGAVTVINRLKLTRFTSGQDVGPPAAGNRASQAVISAIANRPPKGLRADMIQMGSLRVHHMHGGRGTPVLFIHGLGSSGYMEWRFNLEAAAAHHRVYAPDLPGFGRTEKPRARYGIPYFTRFIDRYMEDRGLRSAAVVGTSLGGRIALELTLEHPKRVSKLVLINALGLGRPNMQLYYGLMLMPRVGEAFMKFAGDAVRWAPQPMIRRVAARYAGTGANLKRTMDDNYFANLREIYAADGYGDAYLATIRSLITPKALLDAEHDLGNRLGEIKVPVQLIWGGDDPLFPVAHATRAHSLIKRSRLAVLEGAGHTPQQERPEEFNRVLENFLST